MVTDQPNGNYRGLNLLWLFEEGHINEVKSYLWRGFIFPGDYVYQGISFFPVQSINSLLTRNRDLKNREKNKKIENIINL